METSAVSAHGTGTLFPKHNHDVLKSLVGMLFILEQPVSDSHRHYAVIRIGTVAQEQCKVIVFRIMELIGRAYGISCNCS